MNIVICVSAASMSIMLLLIVCLLCKISDRLNKVHTTLVYPIRIKESQKQRIYWTDENGHRRWRKNND